MLNRPSLTTDREYTDSGCCGIVEHRTSVSATVAAWRVVFDMICRTQATVNLSSAEAFHTTTRATASF